LTHRQISSFSFAWAPEFADVDTTGIAFRCRLGLRVRFD
jgi:hypothetical protein